MSIVIAEPDALRLPAADATSFDWRRLVVIIGFVIFGSSVPIASQAVGFTATEVVERINGVRAAHQLEPLTLEPSLHSAASEHAHDMFARQYFAHDAPDGVTPWDRLRSNGYRFTHAGENIAADFVTVEAIVDAWLASPLHRQNILDPDVVETGVAVAPGILDGKTTTIVVQYFAQRTAVTHLPLPTTAQRRSTPTVLLAKTHVTVPTHIPPSVEPEPRPTPVSEIGWVGEETVLTPPLRLQPNLPPYLGLVIVMTLILHAITVGSLGIFLTRRAGRKISTPLPVHELSTV